MKYICLNRLWIRNPFGGKPVLIMKRELYILTFFCFLISPALYGQMTSAKLDSLTHDIFNQRVKTDSNKYAFKYIIDKRKKSKLLSHIDTTKGDYIFIKESFFYKDQSTVTKEEYFHDGDSIPTVIYDRNLSCEVDDYYYSMFGLESQRILDEELFTPKIKKFKSYLTFQELDYNRIQIRSHGCVDFDAQGKNFEKKKTEELKGTYVIYTLIDRKNDKIWISFQYPPKNPEFSIVRYNPVWDW
ncbi:MAG: hypothetical protein COA58_15820 [Bacteroidetes bacterium]|nr:MAG: hypothetical protein COA58_15820 [Bacteroidota bacterium]